MLKQAQQSHCAAVGLFPGDLKECEAAVKLMMRLKKKNIIFAAVLFGRLPHELISQGNVYYDASTLCCHGSRWQTPFYLLRHKLQVVQNSILVTAKILALPREENTSYVGRVRVSCRAN